MQHTLKLWGVWTPRIFRNAGGWKEKVVGGCTLTEILNARTGFPWTPVSDFNGLTGGKF